MKGAANFTEARKLVQKSIYNFVDGLDPALFYVINIQYHTSVCKCGPCQSITGWIYKQEGDIITESEEILICQTCYGK